MKLREEKKITITELISEGKTDEVFKHIDLKDKTILLIKSRYNIGKNQYHLGVIDNSEWLKIQNQINSILLDLIYQVEEEEENSTEEVVDKNKKNKKEKQINIQTNNDKSIDISSLLPKKKSNKGLFANFKTTLYFLAIRSSETFGYLTMIIGCFLIYISTTWLMNTDKSKELTLLLPSGIGSPDIEKPLLSPEIMLFVFGLIVIIAGFVCTIVSQLFKEEEK